MDAIGQFVAVWFPHAGDYVFDPRYASAGVLAVAAGKLAVPRVISYKTRTATEKKRRAEMHRQQVPPPPPPEPGQPLASQAPPGIVPDEVLQQMASSSADLSGGFPTI